MGFKGLAKCVFVIVLATLFGAPGRAQGQCSVTPVDSSLPKPVLEGKDPGGGPIHGTAALPAGVIGNVQVCVNGIAAGAPVAVAAGGGFSVAPPTPLITGQQIVAQFTSSLGVPGPASDPVTVGSCLKKGTDASLAVPTFTVTTLAASTVGYNGTLPKGNVRICVNDLPTIPATLLVVTPDGKFAGAGLTVKPGDRLVAQAYAGVAPAAVTFGKPSNEQIVTLQIGNGSTKPSGTIVVLIGGEEQSGYSSLGQNSSPFLNAYIQGPVNNRIGGWGRIRLLGAPQPSTQGIVSTFTNPTGQLTTQDYSKVGTAMDFAIGPLIKISDIDKKYGGWDVIAGFGATTPLNSQTVALTYVVPGAGTVECMTLANRFTVKNGYAPGLTLDPMQKTCLVGGYSDVAFSNQDRSRFFLKYGAGFRTTAKFPSSGCATDCTPSYGSLDLTIGQDELVTGGLLRHFVFKMDGVLPIPTGKASFVYVFGSAYIGIRHNQGLSPLILKTETATVTIPSSTVIVLPLQQPDRDFYRLGVGLNINQIFCKMFNSTCPAPSTPAAK